MDEAGVATDEDRATVAVVGGGVIGCAIAATLAPDDEVVLFEADRIAGGATGRSAGLVTIDPAFSDAPAIAEYAMAAFDRFDDEGRVDFHSVPSLEPVPTEEKAIARRRLDRLRTAGVSVQWLDPGTVSSRYPIALGDYAGCLAFERAGWVDPHALTDAYRRTAIDAGATLEVGTAVDAIVVEDGVVTGIETADDRRVCDAVVVAAGWATPRLVRPFLDLPTRPYRTQCVRIEGPAELTRAPMAWIPSADLYFRPDVDGLVVGGMPSFVDDPGTASREADAAFRHHVATALEDLIAIDGPLRLSDGWAGIDLATPDGRPIVDAPDTGPKGLVVATGFHGRGVMTAPVVGPIVRSLLGDDEADETDDAASEHADLPLELFRLDRLGRSNADFSVPGIGD
jgi:glycine/D-amino acid oxidase-like deaminating enzyme